MMAAVTAELLKLRTVRLWWALLIGIVLGSAGLAALTAIFIGSTGPGGSDTAATPVDAAAVRSAYTAGLTVTYLCTMVLGVIVMAGERHHSTLTASVLANPRRWRVVLA